MAEEKKENFLIMRVVKHKNTGTIGGAIKHLYRTRETPNANKDIENIYRYAEIPEIFWANYRKAISTVEKIRSNGVVCAEYFIGASPEWFPTATNQMKSEFCNYSIKWLQKTHGKENIIGIGIHLDEKTPHISAFVVPKDLKTGKLNARGFFGGRARLSKLQTSAWNAIGQPMGLTRGIEGSTQKHETIKKYYGEIEKIEELLRTPSMPFWTALFKNSREKWMERFRDRLRPALEASARARQIDRRNKDMESKVKENEKMRAEIELLQQEKQALIDVFKGLTPEQRNILTGEIEKFQKENKKAAEIKQSEDFTLENEPVNDKNSPKKGTGRK